MTTITSTGPGFAGRLRRLAAGDLGPVPVLLGLAVIWLLFAQLNANYVGARNLSNLILQAGVVSVLAIGVVLVLLIGEIDLSLGSVTGLTGGVLGVVLVERGLPVAIAIAAAICAGALIGLVHGLVIVKVAVPSFIVTLGGLLTWQGAQLWLLGDVGELRVSDGFIRAIANRYAPPALVWGVLVAALALYGAMVFARRRARSRSGLDNPPVAGDLVRLAVAAVGGGLVVAYLSGYFGTPWLLLVLLALVVTVEWICRTTVLGGHLYAIGGNIEAARRAGVPVDRIRIGVFAAASAIAAIGGIVAVSRQFSVSSGTGGGTLLLEAIAAAVIGGTSLFGGRGRPYQALLGALVIVSVSNGLDLLGEPAAVKNMATGLILVLAVSLDAMTRRRRAVAGLR